MAINNPFRPYLDQIPAPFRNRYFIALALFIAWMTFVDRHDILTNIKLQQTLNELKADKVYYEKRIKQVETDRKDMEQNKEKFAREHYFLQKKNEDVFIIVEE